MTSSVFKSYTSVCKDEVNQSNRSKKIFCNGHETPRSPPFKENLKSKKLYSNNVYSKAPDQKQKHKHYVQNRSLTVKSVISDKQLELFINLTQKIYGIKKIISNLIGGVKNVQISIPESVKNYFILLKQECSEKNGCINRTTLRTVKCDTRKSNKCGVVKKRHLNRNTQLTKRIAVGTRAIKETVRQETKLISDLVCCDVNKKSVALFKLLDEIQIFVFETEIRRNNENLSKFCQVKIYCIGHRKCLCSSDWYAGNYISTKKCVQPTSLNNYDGEQNKRCFRLSSPLTSIIHGIYWPSLYNCVFKLGNCVRNSVGAELLDSTVLSCRKQQYSSSTCDSDFGEMKNCTSPEELSKKSERATSDKETHMVCIFKSITEKAKDKILDGGKLQNLYKHFKYNIIEKKDPVESQNHRHNYLFIQPILHRAKGDGRSGIQNDKIQKEINFRSQLLKKQTDSDCYLCWGNHISDKSARQIRNSNKENNSENNDAVTDVFLKLKSLKHLFSSQTRETIPHSELNWVAKENDNTQTVELVPVEIISVCKMGSMRNQFTPESENTFRSIHNNKGTKLFRKISLVQNVTLEVKKAALEKEPAIGSSYESEQNQKRYSVSKKYCKDLKKQTHRLLRKFKLKRLTKRISSLHSWKKVNGIGKILNKYKIPNETVVANKKCESHIIHQHDTMYNNNAKTMISEIHVDRMVDQVNTSSGMAEFGTDAAQNHDLITNGHINVSDMRQLKKFTNNVVYQLDNGCKELKQCGKTMQNQINTSGKRKLKPTTDSKYMKHKPKIVAPIDDNITKDEVNAPQIGVIVGIVDGKQVTDSIQKQDCTTTSSDTNYKPTVSEIHAKNIKYQIITSRTVKLNSTAYSKGMKQKPEIVTSIDAERKKGEINAPRIGKIVDIVDGIQVTDLIQKQDCTTTSSDTNYKPTVSEIHANNIKYQIKTSGIVKLKNTAYSKEMKQKPEIVTSIDAERKKGEINAPRIEKIVGIVDGIQVTDLIQKQDCTITSSDTNYKPTVSEIHANNIKDQIKTSRIVNLKSTAYSKGMKQKPEIVTSIDAERKKGEINAPRIGKIVGIVDGKQVTDLIQKQDCTITSSDTNYKPTVSGIHAKYIKYQIITSSTVKLNSTAYSKGIKQKPEIVTSIDGDRKKNVINALQLEEFKGMVNGNHVSNLLQNSYCKATSSDIYSNNVVPKIQPHKMDDQITLSGIWKLESTADNKGMKQKPEVQTSINDDRKTGVINAPQLEKIEDVVDRNQVSDELQNSDCKATPSHINNNNVDPKIQAHNIDDELTVSGIKNLKSTANSKGIKQERDIVTSIDSDRKKIKINAPQLEEYKDKVDGNQVSDLLQNSNCKATSSAMNNNNSVHKIQAHKMDDQITMSGIKKLESTADNKGMKQKPEVQTSINGDRKTGVINAQQLEKIKGEVDGNQESNLLQNSNCKATSSAMNNNNSAHKIQAHKMDDQITVSEIKKLETTADNKGFHTFKPEVGTSINGYRKTCVTNAPQLKKKEGVVDGNQVFDLLQNSDCKATSGDINNNAVPKIQVHKMDDQITMSGIKEKIKSTFHSEGLKQKPENVTSIVSDTKKIVLNAPQLEEFKGIVDGNQVSDLLQNSDCKTTPSDINNTNAVPKYLAHKMVDQITISGIKKYKSSADSKGMIQKPEIVSSIESVRKKCIINAPQLKEYKGMMDGNEVSDELQKSDCKATSSDINNNNAVSNYQAHKIDKQITMSGIKKLKNTADSKNMKKKRDIVTSIDGYRKKGVINAPQLEKIEGVVDGNQVFDLLQNSDCKATSSDINNNAVPKIQAHKMDDQITMSGKKKKIKSTAHSEGVKQKPEIKTPVVSDTKKIIINAPQLEEFKGIADGKLVSEILQNSDCKATSSDINNNIACPKYQENKMDNQITISGIKKLKSTADSKGMIQKPEIVSSIESDIKKCIINAPQLKEYKGTVDGNEVSDLLQNSDCKTTFSDINSNNAVSKIQAHKIDDQTTISGIRKLKSIADSKSMKKKHGIVTSIDGNKKKGVNIAPQLEEIEGVVNGNQVSVLLQNSDSKATSSDINNRITVSKIQAHEMDDQITIVGINKLHNSADSKGMIQKPEILTSNNGNRNTSLIKAPQYEKLEGVVDGNQVFDLLQNSGCKATSSDINNLSIFSKIQTHKLDDQFTISGIKKLKSTADSKGMIRKPEIVTLIDSDRKNNGKNAPQLQEFKGIVNGNQVSNLLQISYCKATSSDINSNNAVPKIQAHKTDNQITISGIKRLKSTADSKRMKQKRDIVTSIDSDRKNNGKNAPQLEEFKGMVYENKVSDLLQNRDFKATSSDLNNNNAVPKVKAHKMNDQIIMSEIKKEIKSTAHSEGLKQKTVTVTSIYGDRKKKVIYAPQLEEYKDMVNGNQVSDELQNIDCKASLSDMNNNNAVSKVQAHIIDDKFTMSGIKKFKSTADNKGMKQKSEIVTSIVSDKKSGVINASQLEKKGVVDGNQESNLLKNSDCKATSSDINNNNAALKIHGHKIDDEFTISGIKNLKSTADNKGMKQKHDIVTLIVSDRKKNVINAPQFEEIEGVVDGNQVSDLLQNCDCKASSSDINNNNAVFKIQAHKMDDQITISGIKKFKITKGRIGMEQKPEIVTSINGDRKRGVVNSPQLEEVKVVVDETQVTDLLQNNDCKATSRDNNNNIAVPEIQAHKIIDQITISGIKKFKCTADSKGIKQKPEIVTSCDADRKKVVINAPQLEEFKGMVNKNQVSNLLQNRDCAATSSDINNNNVFSKIQAHRMDDQITISEIKKLKITKDRIGMKQKPEIVTSINADRKRGVLNAPQLEEFKGIVDGNQVTDLLENNDCKATSRDNNNNIPVPKIQAHKMVDQITISGIKKFKSTTDSKGINHKPEIVTSSDADRKKVVITAPQLKEYEGVDDGKQETHFIQKRDCNAISYDSNYNQAVSKIQPHKIKDQINVSEIKELISPADSKHMKQKPEIVTSINGDSKKGVINALHLEEFEGMVDGKQVTDSMQKRDCKATFSYTNYNDAVSKIQAHKMQDQINISGIKESIITAGSKVVKQKAVIVTSVDADRKEVVINVLQIGEHKNTVNEKQVKDLIQNYDCANASNDTTYKIPKIHGNIMQDQMNTSGMGKLIRSAESKGMRKKPEIMTSIDADGTIGVITVIRVGELKSIVNGKEIKDLIQKCDCTTTSSDINYKYTFSKFHVNKMQDEINASGLMKLKKTGYSKDMKQKPEVMKSIDADRIKDAVKRTGISFKLKKTCSDESTFQKNNSTTNFSKKLFYGRLLEKSMQNKTNVSTGLNKNAQKNIVLRNKTVQWCADRERERDEFVKKICSAHFNHKLESERNDFGQIMTKEKYSKSDHSSQVYLAKCQNALKKYICDSTHKNQIDTKNFETNDFEKSVIINLADVKINKLDTQDLEADKFSQQPTSNEINSKLVNKIKFDKLTNNNLFQCSESVWDPLQKLSTPKTLLRLGMSVDGCKPPFISNDKCLRRKLESYEEFNFNDSAASAYFYGKEYKTVADAESEYFSPETVKNDSNGIEKATGHKSQKLKGKTTDRCLNIPFTAPELSDLSSVYREKKKFQTEVYNVYQKNDKTNIDSLKNTVDKKWEKLMHASKSEKSKWILLIEASSPDANSWSNRSGVNTREIHYGNRCKNNRNKKVCEYNISGVLMLQSANSKGGKSFDFGKDDSQDVVRRKIKGANTVPFVRLKQSLETTDKEYNISHNSYADYLSRGRQSQVSFNKVVKSDGSEAIPYESDRNHFKCDSFLSRPLEYERRCEFRNKERREVKKPLNVPTRNTRSSNRFKKRRNNLYTPLTSQLKRQKVRSRNEVKTIYSRSAFLGRDRTALKKTRVKNMLNQNLDHEGKYLKSLNNNNNNKLCLFPQEIVNADNSCIRRSNQSADKSEFTNRIYKLFMKRKKHGLETKDGSFKVKNVSKYSNSNNAAAAAGRNSSLICRKHKKFYCNNILRTKCHLTNCILYYNANVQPEKQLFKAKDWLHNKNCVVYDSFGHSQFRKMLSDNINKAYYDYVRKNAKVSKNYFLNEEDQPEESKNAIEMNNIQSGSIYKSFNNFHKHVRFLQYFMKDRGICCNM